jgi:hypothetical protein
MGDRAVIHLPGGADDPHLPGLLAYCEVRGYRIVGVCHDLAGAVDTIGAGNADIVVCLSRRSLLRLESLTADVTEPIMRYRRDHPSRTRRVPR